MKTTITTTIISIFFLFTFAACNDCGPGYDLVDGVCVCECNTGDGIVTQDPGVVVTPFNSQVLTGYTSVSNAVEAGYHFDGTNWTLGWVHTVYPLLGFNFQNRPIYGQVGVQVLITQASMQGAIEAAVAQSDFGVAVVSLLPPQYPGTMRSQFANGSYPYWDQTTHLFGGAEPLKPGNIGF